MDIYFILALFIFFWLLYLVFWKPKEEKTSWICQNCQTKLVREEIKFGLCPKCGVKIKDFRGLSAFDKPFGYGILP